MKCKYCGGKITLEDLNCPYCGKQNEIAYTHAKEMKEYKKDYSDIRKEVHSTNIKYSRYSTRLITIAVLASLSVLVWYFYYDGIIDEFAKEKYTEYKADDYIKYIEECLENEEYTKLGFFFRNKQNDIYGNKKLRETFKKYNNLGIVADKYAGIYYKVMDFVEEQNLRKEYDIKSLENALDEFETYMNDSNKFFKEDEYYSHILKMRKKLDTLVKLYVN